MQFRKVKDLPSELKTGAIEKAVFEFIAETPLKADPNGLFKQTIRTIASATFLGGQNDFWLAWNEEGDVLGYLIGQTVVDVDDSLTYWITQAWVSPRLRSSGAVKDAFRLVCEDAKSRFCRHIVVVSGRKNDAAYCRFLGNGWHKYATLLKKDI